MEPQTCCAGARRTCPRRRPGGSWSPGADVPGLDIRLPRTALLEDLARACYYLVMPRQKAAEHQAEVYGCYVHLEYDARPGQGAELRLLADHSHWGLVPVPVLLTQPTLAWSAAMLTAEGAGTPLARDMADVGQVLAWWVWPLLGALLDHDTQLTKTAVLDGAEVDPNVRSAEVWQITNIRPPVLTPVE